MNELIFDLRLQRADFELWCKESLPDSGVTGIYGPSGCGKSSLLRSIAGLEPATGHIRFRNQTWLKGQGSLPAHQRGVAMVFQGSQLMPHLSVLDNLRWAHKRRFQDQGDSPENLLQWLGLSTLGHRFPADLSGGEYRRAAIGQTLALSPRLLLLDEPLTGLDALAREHLMSVLEETAHRCRAPILLVSHQWSELARLAEQVLVMDRGRIVERGHIVDLSGDPGSLINRGADASALLTATVAAHDNHDGLSRVVLTQGTELWIGQLQYAIGTRLRLQVPARDVSLTLKPAKDSSIMNILPCTLLQLDDCGTGQVTAQLDLSGQHLLARITRRSAQRLKLKPGMNLYAQVKTVALLSDRAGH